MELFIFDTQTHGEILSFWDIVLQQKLVCQRLKSFSCAAEGRGKTTASVGLDCDFSGFCPFFFFFPSSQFHLMPLQNTGDSIKIIYFYNIFLY